jgi:hypothetical protein
MSRDASERKQPTATPRMRLGASGERLAANWLEARGYQIIATNWHCAYGEADLIAEREGELIFVEVKTRRGAGNARGGGDGGEAAQAGRHGADVPDGARGRGARVSYRRDRGAVNANRAAG